MKKRFLFISCEEAQHICDKAQYNEASLWEKFKLKLRLSYCRITRAYYKRNVKLTEVVKCSKAKCLEPKERKAMEMTIKEELTKH